MTSMKAIMRIMSEYPGECSPESIVSLDRHAGLDGVLHWRMETAAGPLCLRCRPKRFQRLDHLQYSQAVLWHAVCEGIDFVPLPLETIRHRGYVYHGERYWELLPWLPGENEPFESVFVPGYPRGSGTDRDANRTENVGLSRAAPSQPAMYRKMALDRLASAMIGLAQFHEATSTFPLPNEPLGPSPAVAGCLARLEPYFDPFKHPSCRRPHDQSLSGQSLSDHPFFPEHRRREWNLRLEEFQGYIDRCRDSLPERLRQAGRLNVPIQPCIGNAHRRHILYDTEGLSGMIDFKEMSADSVALDIASLLGTLAGNDSQYWTYGLKAYGTVRPLSKEERELIAVLDLAGMLLTTVKYRSLLTETTADFTFRQCEAMLDEIAWHHHRLTDYENHRGAA